jgi:hypothetical protein
MQEADRLVAKLQKRAPDLHDIAGEQFALVGDVLLSVSPPRRAKKFQLASSNFPTYHMMFIWPTWPHCHG